MEARAVIFFQSLLIISHFSLCSCSTDTITINQTIKDGHLLISQQNYFALGFFSPGKSNYRYLGIWFHKVPQQTVVWVANRNNRINGSSGTLSIDQTGNLVLYSDQERKFSVWSSNVSVENGYGFEAQLLDTGNLVLVQNRSRRIIWQSFDYPSNTMIQGMKLGIDKKTGFNRFLNSWKSPDDPATGDYSYRLDPNGSPQIFIYKGTEHVRWRSGPWPWRSYAEVYNYSFVNNQEEIYFSFFLDYSSVVLMTVIDELGFLRRLTWHESEGQWKEFWSAPKHRCDTYGQCGANSLCDPYNFTSYECSCLPGFEPKSPRDWHWRDGSGGCVRKRTETFGKEDGFMKMAIVKMPDTKEAVWVDYSTSRINCENICKSNGSCTAYASIPVPEGGAGCLQWFGELMDTVDHADYGYDTYIRVDAVELAEDTIRSNRTLKMKKTMVILIFSVVSAWCVVCILAYLWLWRRRGKNRRNKRSIDRIIELDDSRRHTEIVFLSFDAILLATNNLSAANKIGQGGFGSVYKGQLANGQEIAVKRLSQSSGQGRQEFKNEVMLIAKLQHRNLVKLLGCCIQGEERILIYEYLPNGSLDTFLFDHAKNSLLDWRIRFAIILGIARGILYLHQDSRLRVIHRDLKSSNILLDAEMNPKISDFGLARILKGDQIQYKTNRVVGTYGYMSPEYAVFGKFSTKSDVFSFGVILLEIISGKKSNGFFQEDPSLNLIGHVWELWRENRVLEIIDSSLKELYNSHEALRCIRVGLLCVQEDALDRPDMLDVTLMLSSETTLPSPKQPAFIFRKSCSTSGSSLMENDRSCSINDLTVTDVSTR